VFNLKLVETKGSGFHKCYVLLQAKKKQAVSSPIKRLSLGLSLAAGSLLLQQAALIKRNRIELQPRQNADRSHRADQ